MKFESQVSRRKRAVELREAIDEAEKAVEAPVIAQRVQQNILRARAATARFARRTE